MRRLAGFLLLALAMPVFGQTVFRVANGAEPQSLDPQLGSGMPGERVLDALFEGLMIPSPATGAPVGGIARSWSVSRDGLTCTFRLRPGLAWSDGVPITARTVYDSWVRELAPATAAAEPSLMAGVIKGADAFNAGRTADPRTIAMKVVDPLTFQFTMVEPTPSIAAIVTHHSFDVVPTHAIAKWGAAWATPGHLVGNGPYVLQSWKANDRIVVAKNPKYWDARNVKVDQIVYFPAGDQAAYAMYAGGQVDWDAGAVPPDKVAEASARPGKDYLRALILASYFYEFNVQKPPFDDPRLRIAFSMAAGRQGLVDTVTRRGEVPATTLVPAIGPARGPSGIPEDVEAARKLLADAGYPGGQGLPTIRILYDAAPWHEAIAEYLQRQWRETLGATVELAGREWSTYLDARRDGAMGSYELVRAGWVADYADPQAFLGLFSSDNLEWNDMRWSDPRYDALLAKASALPVGPERTAALSDAEQILVGEELPILPLYFPVSQNLIDLAKWGGWTPNALDRHEPKFLFRK